MASAKSSVGPVGMTWTPGWQTQYQGFRSCSQTPQSSTTVQIPPGLWEKSDAEQIAVLALMLAHQEVSGASFRED